MNSESNVRAETHISAEHENSVPSTAKALGTQVKWVAIRVAAFGSAMLVGWSCAWLVQSAYNSYEPLKTMLAPIGRFFQNLAELMSLVFK